MDLINSHCMDRISGYQLSKDLFIASGIIFEGEKPLILEAYKSLAAVCACYIPPPPLVIRPCNCL